MMRLDKYLASVNVGTRSQVKQLIKKGLVAVNGQIITENDHKIHEDTDSITCQGKPLHFSEYEYYLLNKPIGCVSATKDLKEKTVLSYLPKSHKPDIFPVGRLDKDTEGLLLITNDGDLAHRLLSPGKHVNKTYETMLSGPITDEIITAFEQGMDIGDDKVTLPARIAIIDNDTDKTHVLVTIHEGRYHQIKRMFQAFNLKVLYLKRISMGDLNLDTLQTGEWRMLTNSEIEMLKGGQKDNEQS